MTFGKLISFFLIENISIGIGVVLFHLINPTGLAEEKCLCYPSIRKPPHNRTASAPVTGLEVRDKIYVNGKKLLEYGKELSKGEIAWIKYFSKPSLYHRATASCTFEENDMDVRLAETLGIEKVSSIEIKVPKNQDSAELVSHSVVYRCAWPHATLEEETSNRLSYKIPHDPEPGTELKNNLKSSIYTVDRINKTDTSSSASTNGINECACYYQKKSVPFHGIQFNRVGMPTLSINQITNLQVKCGNNIKGFVTGYNQPEKTPNRVAILWNYFLAGMSLVKTTRNSGSCENAAQTLNEFVFSLLGEDSGNCQLVWKNSNNTSIEPYCTQPRNYRKIKETPKECEEAEEGCSEDFEPFEEEPNQIEDDDDSAVYGSSTDTTTFSDTENYSDSTTLSEMRTLTEKTTSSIVQTEDQSDLIKSAMENILAY